MNINSNENPKNNEKKEPKKNNNSTSYIAETENNTDTNNQRKNYNRGEKIVLIYLLIIAILLLFFAQFFIHDIISIGTATTIRDSETVEIIEIDSLSRIKVTEDKFNKSTKWGDLVELSIFNNYYYRFNGQSKIAPGVQGTYNFSVENECDRTFNYIINFEEENPYNVNMVYKLKKNGKYVLGSETEWVEPAKLGQPETFLDSLQRDMYTLEWRWEDTDHDTQIGESKGAYYRIFIQVQAEQIMPEIPSNTEKTVEEKAE